MKTDNRNMTLAILLSALVLIGWSFLSDKYFPQPAPQTQAVEDGKVKPAPAAPSAAAASPERLRNRTLVLADSPRVAIESPSLKGSINLKGARLDDLSLVRERETIAKDAPAVRLFSPSGAAAAHFAQFGWSGDGLETPGPDTVWTASSPTLAPGKPVTLSWQNATGQRFDLTVAIDDGYLFTVTQKVSNLGSGAVAVRPYGLISRDASIGTDSVTNYHTGPIAYLNGKADYDVDFDTLDEDKSGISRDSKGGWLGFTDKYWLTALVPASDASITADFRKGGNAYQADYIVAPTVIAPGKAISTEARLFAGAKEHALLSRYEDEGITKLSKSIDWGWFEWFMRPIFWLLRELFQLTGNFGVAIIGLTLVVRAILFPIADKQFRSMAGMRRLQPKMKEIQDRYKDDKPRLQQEMLKLYQTEKINPAAGCLPILLQIPVFYALYKTLMVSVEMRHQPFVLWIKDLSAPDPMTPVNLFGLLDFTPPAFLALGVLPILLGITMWLQFKLNPAQMDPVQQQIFSIMPWVLMFAMAGFAAGLQLYWVVNNILSMAQQKWLYWRYDHMAVPAAEATVTVPAKKKK